MLYGVLGAELVKYMLQGINYLCLHLHMAYIHSCCPCSFENSEYVMTKEVVLFIHDLAYEISNFG